MFSILFADDDHSIRLVAEIYFKTTDFVCDFVKNGVEAVEKIKTNKYDLMLLDISMPKKNGYEVLCESRQINIKTPIFMLTGDSENSSREKCMQAGATAYVNKPICLDKLILKIKTFLTQKE